MTAIASKWMIIPLVMVLIRGTGRTDFQNGDAGAQYDSLFGRLLSLPEQTLIYPAHDYKGETVSTIEEKAFNPRLQVSSISLHWVMNNLDLPNPKMMDVAVPENMKMGITLMPNAKWRILMPAACWHDIWRGCDY